MTANRHPISLSWILVGGLIGLLLSPALKICCISTISVQSPLALLGFLAGCVGGLLELPFHVVGSVLRLPIGGVESTALNTAFGYTYLNSFGYALVMLFWGIVGSLAGYVIDRVISNRQQ